MNINTVIDTRRRVITRMIDMSCLHYESDMCSKKKADRFCISFHFEAFFLNETDVTFMLWTLH